MKDIQIKLGKEYEVSVNNGLVKCTITAEQLEKAFSSELAFDSLISMIKSDIKHKDLLDRITEAAKLCSEHKII